MPTEEAIDLIRSLGFGSKYIATSITDMSWTYDQHQLASVLDMLHIINWRLMGCPEDYKPVPMARPGDGQRQRIKSDTAKSVRERLLNTKWKDA